VECFKGKPVQIPTNNYEVPHEKKREGRGGVREGLHELSTAGVLRMKYLGKGIEKIMGGGLGGIRGMVL